MFKFNLSRVFTLSALCLVSPILLAQEQDQDLAKKAYGILKTNCYRCHGVEFKVAGFNVLDRESLTKSRGVEEQPYVAVKDPEGSYLYSQISGNAMPPSNAPERKTFTEADGAVLKRWIEAGAPFPKAGAERKPIQESQVLSAILTNLIKLKPNDRAKYRFFSFAHLYNNPSVTEEDLRLNRAALAKLLASLSRRADGPEILTLGLEEGTEHGTTSSKKADAVIVRIDLDKFGWPDKEWRSLMATYPYGLRLNDTKLRPVQQAILDAVGKGKHDAVPYVRADWFVARASMPTHYHALLGTPETVEALEADLKITSQADFKNNEVQRAGFAPSGISKNNRLVDRHVGGDTKYYYRSYDFATSVGRKLLFRFPLGPKFDDNEFKDHAFEADGGEIIYRLPNGLHAYMIIDKQGKRLNEAPVDIVRDVKEHANTVKVLNGISCIGCHRHGIQPYQDQIGQARVVAGDARAKVTDIYTSPEKMAEILAEDRRDYLDSLDRIIGKYLKVGDDAGKKIEDFPEPIYHVVQRYSKDLNAEEARYELSFSSDLKAVVDVHAELQEIGLGPLARGGSIPRSLWESSDGSPETTFQAVAQVLDIGDGTRITTP